MSGPPPPRQAGGLLAACTTVPPVDTPRPLRWAAVAGIALISAGLSLGGIHWGLTGWGLTGPHEGYRAVMPLEFAAFHPDEPFVVDGGLRAQAGEALQPNHYFWGGTGIFTVASGLAEGCRIAGWTPASLRTDRAAEFMLLGRLFSALAAALAAWALYRAVRLWAGELGGVLAAGLFAVTPVAVENATTFRPDMPADQWEERNARLITQTQR